MYKTIWKIYDTNEATTTRMTYYHFGKEQKFPSWYMGDNHNYLIRSESNLKLKYTLVHFIKCLYHYWIIH